MLTAIMLLAGCSMLQAPQVENTSTYVLDARPSHRIAAPPHDLVLAVSMPHTRPGFDTPQMAYVQQPHELNYYAVNRWVDTPAHMLAPLLTQALEQSGGFRAVVRTPGPVPADIRLDTELIRLQQDFATHPSQVEITLRAQLVDVRSQQVLAVKQFDETEAAPGENAYGGVVAANRALQRMLDQLAEFCMRASATRHASP